MFNRGRNVCILYQACAEDGGGGVWGLEPLSFFKIIITFIFYKSVNLRRSYGLRVYCSTDWYSTVCS